MEKTLCHPNLKETSRLIADLASASPFKLTRYRDLHAKALDFKSYQELAAVVKDKPIFFDLNTFFDNVVYYAEKEHGVYHLGGSENVEKFHEKLLDYQRTLSTPKERQVKYLRLDFQLLSMPWAGKRPEYSKYGILNSHDISHEYGYTTINEFLAKIVTPKVQVLSDGTVAPLGDVSNDTVSEGKPVYQLESCGGLRAGELVVLSGRPKYPKSRLIHPLPKVDYFTSPVELETNNQTLVSMDSEVGGFRLSQSQLSEKGSTIFLTSSRGDLAHEWKGFKIRKDDEAALEQDKELSEAFLTGYGSLFVKLNPEVGYDVILKDDDKDLLVELSDEPQERGEAPLVSFVGMPKVCYVSANPTEEDGHICFTADVYKDKSNNYPSADFIPAISTDEAYTKHLGDTPYEGTLCIPVDKNGMVLESLNEEWKGGLNVEVEHNLQLVSFYRPTGLDTYLELGKDVAQGVHAIHNTIKEYYRLLEEYQGYSFQDTTAKDSCSIYTTHLEEDVYVEVTGINYPLVELDKLVDSRDEDHDGEYLLKTSIPMHIQMAGTPEKFAKLLTAMGVNSIQFIELGDDFTLDMYGNLFTCYTTSGEVSLNFVVNSANGRSEHYCEFLSSLSEEFGTGLTKTSDKLHHFMQNKLK
ncbi:hypothetical protein [Vibrio crassostreae]|uniref:hypothetical protein n=1 Tax=Vibrio crassostreae TaxID=246167 RepID=UPI001B3052F9|nr:hypothetical protein [Vibrio crassostreae]